MTGQAALTADGKVIQTITGPFQYIYFRSVTGASQYSFDGQNWFQVNLNDYLGPIPTKPTRVYFRATGNIAVNIAFDYSMSPFGAQATQQKNQSTYPYGTNFASGTLPPNGGNGAPIIGVNNGHQRKTILFTVLIPQSSVILTDGFFTPIGAVFAGNPPFPIDTDGTILVKAGNFNVSIGAPDLIVGEIYYNE
jgi:hypothetical protein